MAQTTGMAVDDNMDFSWLQQNIFKQKLQTNNKKQKCMHWVNKMRDPTWGPGPMGPMPLGPLILCIGPRLGWPKGSQKLCKPRSKKTVGCMSWKCKMKLKESTLWSCRVHVGEHRMRTWSSTWWLQGEKNTKHICIIVFLNANSVLCNCSDHHFIQIRQSKFFLIVQQINSFFTTIVQAWNLVHRFALGHFFKLLGVHSKCHYGYQS